MRLKRTSKPARCIAAGLSLALLAVACEGDQGPMGPPGADGLDGLDGLDGNANVTMYIFDGHDFRDFGDGGDGFRAQDCIPDVSHQEMFESAWLYYLVRGIAAYSVPGRGLQGASEYRAYATFAANACSGAPLWRVDREDGDGEDYESIRIVQIEAGDVVDMTTTAGDVQAPWGDGIAADLDLEDYEAVVDFFGLDEEDAIRVGR